MNKNGVIQDITYFPINSIQNMVIQVGEDINISLVRISVDTEIEYFDDNISNWQSGKVVSYDSVKVDNEVVVLMANTPVRFKENPSVSGLLILSTKKYSIEYNAEDLQQMYQFLYASGIVRNKLFGNIIASGGREITITSSMFVIDGFVGFFKVPQKIVVDGGDFSIRKDLLVLRKVQSEGDVYLAIKKGIPRPNPTAPTLEQNQNGIYEIPIAEIHVQANTQTISQSDITDKRPTIISVDNPVIPLFYTQYTDIYGNFLEEEAPTNYYKRYWNIDTIWELMFANEGVFFRTEGDLANENRVNGIQQDAMQKISGTQDVGILPAYHNFSTVGSLSSKNNLDWGFNISNSRGCSNKEAILVLDSSKQTRVSTETRSKNRLKRVWKRIV